jgi:glycosyltransferase involved in cell wall biosynthesis
MTVATYVWGSWPILADEAAGWNSTQLVRANGVQIWEAQLRLPLSVERMNLNTIAPKVTFVVPCFELAHFLGECVSSILFQTYGNFEVLIMDDCSPDDTESVARAIPDPRVKYIRNERNLGHLRNYNKGIQLARGEYVWLISADDRLKQPYVLSRYVDVMEKHREVGYIFSPAIALLADEEGSVMGWTAYADKDAIVSGRQFLREIMYGNYVAAPTAMVRKNCYDSVSYFPLDLHHTGDWYLWCLFALHFDVAFLSEPMTYYRTHGENMSLALRKIDERIVRDNLNLARWKLRAKARDTGADVIVRHFDRMLGNKYANQIAQRTYHQDAVGPTLEEFEEALKANVVNAQEQRGIRANMYRDLGEQAFRVGNIVDARHNYATSLGHKPWQPIVWIKKFLLQMGKFGISVRTVFKMLRGT